MSGILNFAIDKVKTKLDESCEYGNVGTSERILSVIAGGFIIGMGARKLFSSPLTAISGLTLGGALVFRGVTGSCPIKEAVEGKQPDATVVEHRYFVK
ncbi:YgaP family membrane protein [Sphingobacterium lactis]|uniref:YgaP family membrane protein n=1 Tax=Sphingobacterium lactis TaxID=797291 RepID=UPI003DA47D49